MIAIPQQIRKKKFSIRRVNIVTPAGVARLNRLTILLIACQIRRIVVLEVSINWVRRITSLSHLLTRFTEDLTDLTEMNQKLLNRVRVHDDIDSAWPWNGNIWCVTKKGQKN